jgi:hypothetical protein
VSVLVVTVILHCRAVLELDFTVCNSLGGRGSVPYLPLQVFLFLNFFLLFFPCAPTHS